jgi:hypothetical protein
MQEEKDFALNEIKQWNLIVCNVGVSDGKIHVFYT